MTLRGALIVSMSLMGMGLTSTAKAELLENGVTKSPVVGGAPLLPGSEYDLSKKTDRTAPKWTDNDIAQAAFILPAGIRLELLRWRYTRFQMSLLHASFAISWNLRAQFGGGLVGLGAHWPVDAKGTEEYGFMIWPLSAQINDTFIVGYLNSQAYYRWNNSWTFVETGLLFAPVWLAADLQGDSPEIYPMENPMLSAYIGIGF